MICFYFFSFFFYRKGIWNIIYMKDMKQNLVKCQYTEVIN